MADFVQGSAFVNPPSPGLPSHFWFILSDPQADPSNVLVANITSDHHDTCCPLEPSDHAWIRRTSYVNFTDSKITKLTDLEAVKAHLTMQPPLALETLEKILAAAAKTDELPAENRQLLERQGLI